MIRVIDTYTKNFIKPEELEAMGARVRDAHEMLHAGTGEGSEMLGWVDLPVNYDQDEFVRIKAAARKIQDDSDILVVIGIGGSYLGARAVIDLLGDDGGVEVVFAGNSLSSVEVGKLLKKLSGKDVSLNIVSKSGTTTEPAIVFRILKEFMEKKYGKDEAAKRIFATTDKAKGALKTLSDKEGYETFVVPDDIGGRYSVLTAVGLLPIAVAGIDIDGLMEGAAGARNDMMAPETDKNMANKYVAIRNVLYEKGYDIEVLAAYEPSFATMNEWWKQLYGESEGKDGKGIFPASVIYTMDLHSMGQYIQDGRRNLQETVVNFTTSNYEAVIPRDKEDLDGLNFLEGKKVSEANLAAMKATVIAHCDGGVPNVTIEVDEVSERAIGYLIYFFEKACAVSGYVLGVNPFNQPGVEAYKNNMFALLGKPGYEDLKLELDERMARDSA